MSISGLINFGIEKIFYVLEKFITTRWVIWTHRNNTTFRNDECDPCIVLELAKHPFMKQGIISNALIFLVLQELQILTIWMQVKYLLTKTRLLLFRNGQRLIRRLHKIDWLSWQASVTFVETQPEVFSENMEGIFEIFYF